MGSTINTQIISNVSNCQHMASHVASLKANMVFNFNQFFTNGLKLEGNVQAKINKRLISTVNQPISWLNNFAQTNKSHPSR